jgi:uncharacterized protein with ParB-like and HNH nuclease domain/predicted transport protein
LDFLKKSPQFVIPIYQRKYAWTEKDCRQLWDDIVRTGENDQVDAHFIGSIVYVQQGLYRVTTPSPLLVIDGQQRLATLTLLIAALAESLENLDEDHREPMDGFSARKLRNYYLLNPDESDERRFKLILSQTDKDSLIAVLDKREQPPERSLRVTQNYELFKSWVAECHGDVAAVCKGLSKLMIVDVALTRDHDNPQLVFESMNSTGKKLQQADLIRNFVLMGLEPKLQTRLYEQYWRPMELDFGQEAYDSLFDAFMRYYLTVRTGILANRDLVYDTFKDYARLPQMTKAGVEELVADIRCYAHYFCSMALDKEPDADLRAAFGDLQDLKADVIYPLLLELYHDYTQSILARLDFLAALRLIESYIFRRAVCSIPTNSMDKTFSTFTKALRKDQYLESIQAHLLLLPSYRHLPDDQEFESAIKLRNLYVFPRRSYYLRRLENHDRKERVSVEEYTVEHILPQNENLALAWQTALGPDWQRVQKMWLHTLGNLTLTGYNSEYSDRPFAEKRDMKGGFRDSPLRLNAGLGRLDNWNEEAIGQRADRLAKLALDVWSVPRLLEETLNSYRTTTARGTYSREDHPHLLASPVRELFDAFSKDVRALDPNVTEEFLKLYVAYKAETNFVDVVPQAKRLRLSLNIPFSEINDPRGMCKDVSELGRWGNGDVEVMLSSLDDLPYVVGLVRQALERQLDNGESHAE